MSKVGTISFPPNKAGPSSPWQKNDFGEHNKEPKESWKKNLRIFYGPIANHLHRQINFGAFSGSLVDCVRVFLLRSRAATEVNDQSESKANLMEKSFGFIFVIWKVIHFDVCCWCAWQQAIDDESLSLTRISRVSEISLLPLVLLIDRFLSSSQT